MKKLLYIFLLTCIASLNISAGKNKHKKRKYSQNKKLYVINPQNNPPVFLENLPITLDSPCIEKTDLIWDDLDITLIKNQEEKSYNICKKTALRPEVQKLKDEIENYEALADKLKEFKNKRKPKFVKQ